MSVKNFNKETYNRRNASINGHTDFILHAYPWKCAVNYNYQVRLTTPRLYIFACSNQRVRNDAKLH